MSTNKIDEMTEEQAKSLLNDICAVLNICGKERSRSVVIGSIENHIRRSKCLGMVDAVYNYDTKDAGR